MANPDLRLMDLTGPLSAPANVVLFQVQQQGGGGRKRLGRVPMAKNDELDRNLFVFDEHALVRFENPFQFRLVLTNDNLNQLGETIIEASDADSPKDRLTIRMFIVAGGPFYELGYKVVR